MAKVADLVGKIRIESGNSLQTLRKFKAELQGIAKSFRDLSRGINVQQAAKNIREISKHSKEAAKEQSRLTRERLRLETATVRAEAMLNAQKMRSEALVTRQRHQQEMLRVRNSAAAARQQARLQAGNARRGIIDNAVLGRAVGFFGGFKVLETALGDVANLEKSMFVLETAMGDTEKAAQGFRDVLQISRELSVDLSQAVFSFSQLAAATKGTSIEGEQTLRIFKAVSLQAAATGASVEDFKGVFRAVRQIATKGKVQAEELVGQLGERIPGAINLMAEGLGVTRQELFKLMEKGAVPAEKALNALAGAIENSVPADAVSKRANTITGAMNNLRTQITETFTGLDPKSPLQQGIIKAIQILTELVRLAEPAVHAIGVALNAMLTPFKLLADFSSMFNANLIAAAAAMLLIKERAKVALVYQGALALMSGGGISGFRDAFRKEKPGLNLVGGPVGLGIPTAPGPTGLMAKFPALQKFEKVFAVVNKGLDFLGKHAFRAAWIFLLVGKVITDAIEVLMEFEGVKKTFAVVSDAVNNLLVKPFKAVFDILGTFLQGNIIRDFGLIVEVAALKLFLAVSEFYLWIKEWMPGFNNAAAEAMGKAFEGPNADLIRSQVLNKGFGTVEAPVTININGQGREAGIAAANAVSEHVYKNVGRGAAAAAAAKRAGGQ